MFLLVTFGHYVCTHYVPTILYEILMATQNSVSDSLHCYLADQKVQNEDSVLVFGSVYL